MVITISCRKIGRTGGSNSTELCPAVETLEGAVPSPLVDSHRREADVRRLLLLAKTRKSPAYIPFDASVAGRELPWVRRAGKYWPVQADLKAVAAQTGRACHTRAPLPADEGTPMPPGVVTVHLVYVTIL